MKHNNQTTKQFPWRPWQRIAFRFFFIFLSIQVLTENFIGNWFGYSLVIWRLGEQIFVAPCLWLNKHLFHFHYIPASWTTFSLGLHTIRDTAYLALAIIGAAVWTIIDKKRASYNKLLYWFSRCLIIALSCIAFTYGIVKVFPVQMATPSFLSLQKPFGNLTPFELLWATYGIGKPYQVFTGIFEMLGALLILFPRTRVPGLLLIVAVMMNVILINYTYQIGVLILSFIILLIALFLLAPYANSLYIFFFEKQETALGQIKYHPPKNLRSTLFTFITLSILGLCYFFSFRSALNLYNRRAEINATRKYYMVKDYVLNNDSMRLIENDTLRWRVWSESMIDGKRYVTIATMNPDIYKAYTLQQDTTKHSLKLSSSGDNANDSIVFTYSDVDTNHRTLSGMIKQSKVLLSLQKINPDSSLQLLKSKRIIVTFDDEEGNE